MMRAFAAIATTSRGRKAEVYRSVEQAKSMGLMACLQTDRLAVLASGDLAFQSLKGIMGAVIGDVFPRHIPAAAKGAHGTAFEEMSDIFMEDRAQAELWGDYVAVHIAADGSLRFIHSPCGSINLFYLACNDILFIASDSSTLLTLAGRRRSINWAAIAQNLVRDDVSSSETCIDDVREIRCGEAGRWRGGAVSVEMAWNPWDYTETDIAIWSREEAVGLVRHELLRSVRARRTVAGQFAIDLSGGLDSSIIAAACAVSGMEAACINLFDPETEGDERRFARCVADDLRFELVEAIPSTDDVDLNLCARGHLPRPYTRSFVQAFDNAASQAASRLGATVFLNGGGGDSVFGHLQSSGPVVDAVKSRGRAPSVIRTAHEVSRAAQCSIWDVAKKAGQKILRGSRPSQITASYDFVSAECGVIAETVTPQLPIPRTQPLPGKIEQVHGILRALYNLNGFSRSDHMKGIFPLLSQPLVEACLRIPTWLSVGEGRNRLIARLAMESYLPQMAVWRTSKGGLGRLQRDIVRTKRDQIREMLLDGALSGQGLIDRPAVERELKDEASYRIENAYRLMRLCDIEAWCSA